MKNGRRISIKFGSSGDEVGESMCKETHENSPSGGTACARFQILPSHMRNEYQRISQRIHKSIKFRSYDLVLSCSEFFRKVHRKNPLFIGTPRIHHFCVQKPEIFQSTLETIFLGKVHLNVTKE